MHAYNTKIIVGDFNADQLCSSADATFIRRFIDDNGLHNIPYGATYHRDTSDTWLDLCLVDKPNSDSENPSYLIPMVTTFSLPP